MMPGYESRRTMAYICTCGYFNMHSALSCLPDDEQLAINQELVLLKVSHLKV